MANEALFGSPTDRLRGIITALNELTDDNTVPRNVKSRIQKIVEILNDPSELSIKVDKSLQELDEVADDSNVQSYTRTQIWNIVSLLEKL